MTLNGHTTERSIPKIKHNVQSTKDMKYMRRGSGVALLLDQKVSVRDFGMPNNLLDESLVRACCKFCDRVMSGVYPPSLAESHLRNDKKDDPF